MNGGNQKKKTLMRPGVSEPEVKAEGSAVPLEDLAAAQAKLDEAKIQEQRLSVREVLERELEQSLSVLETMRALEDLYTRGPSAILGLDTDDAFALMAVHKNTVNVLAHKGISVSTDSLKSAVIDAASIASFERDVAQALLFKLNETEQKN